MKIGEIFSGSVRGLTSAGLGVVQHPSGRVVFIEGVWLGEAGSFRVTEKRGRIGFASIETLEQTSDARVTPKCTYHGIGSKSCGGCAWQFVSYPAQLEAKQKRIDEAMHRVDPRIASKSILASAKEFGYRNRAQLKTDGTRLGYVATKSHNLVDVDVCPILTDHNQALLTELRSELPNTAWKPARKHNWTTLNIDKTITVKESVVNSRLPFLQGNDDQNTTMKAWLLSHLQQLDTNSKVLELFSGSGNFTEVIADCGFSAIHAVEGDEFAVNNLTKRGLANVTTQVCDLFSDDSLRRLLKMHADTEVLVLDPPRAGLKSREGLFTKKSKLRHILYVSCDLATFTRDLATFLENGFKVVELQPLDLFPQTPHLELMCYLRKK